MSDLWASTYDRPGVVTESDSANDPAGPFAGLLVSVAGTLKVTPLNGAAIAFTVVAGQYVRFPVVRVWSTGTSATVIGLIGAIQQPGFK